MTKRKQDQLAKLKQSRDNRIYNAFKSNKVIYVSCKICKKNKQVSPRHKWSIGHITGFCEACSSDYEFEGRNGRIIFRKK